jgi:glycosyltransferase involved in cell wall biosynthesis
MRILNVIQCTNLGGMEQSNLLRLKALVARGHSVRLVSLTPLGSLAPFLARAGIPSTGLSYRGKFGWRSFLEMRRAFRKEPHDAVLITGHNVLTCVALLGCPGPKIQSIHYHHFENGRGYTKWKIIYLIESLFIDKFIFISDFIRNEAIKIHPVIASRSVRIRNSFPLKSVASPSDRLSARARLGLQASEIVIGACGWLVKRKRFEVFLRVCAVLSKKYPNATFLVAGDGPKKAALEQLAEELDIGLSSVFLGWVSDMEDFYRAVDLVIFNSDFDAVGRVPLEALGYGVPVVASVLHGGLKEFFEPSDPITILDEHNVDHLAEAALDILDNYSLRESVIRTGRARVGEHGDAERHAQEIEQLLLRD